MPQPRPLLNYRSLFVASVLAFQIFGLVKNNSLPIPEIHEGWCGSFFPGLNLLRIGWFRDWPCTFDDLHAEERSAYLKESVRLGDPAWLPHSDDLLQWLVMPELGCGGILHVLCASKIAIDFRDDGIPPAPAMFAR